MKKATATDAACQSSVQAVLAQIDLERVDKPNPRKPIKARDDLSFTYRDDRNHLCNWNVSHGDGMGDELTAIGRMHFAEVVELFLHSPEEATQAIRFALGAGDWDGRGNVETGFAQEVAEMAIAGLAAIAQRAAIDGAGEKA